MFADDTELLADDDVTPRSSDTKDEEEVGTPSELEFGTNTDGATRRNDEAERTANDADAITSADDAEARGDDAAKRIGETKDEEKKSQR